MNAADIVVDQLRVVAGGRTILRIDALTVEHGEFVAILGPNGAGKSSLLQTCLGLRRPTEGRVTVLGQEVTALHGAALARLRRDIGYVPQDSPAHSQMPLTVREVVAIGRTGRAGLARRLQCGDWRIVDQWIDGLGLRALRDAAYSQLSGGEQRKVLLARGMVQEPRLLLLDEPAAHLDLRSREHIVATLRALYEQTHATTVVVCHELEVLPTCCRRVVLLQDGQVTATGSPETVLTPERVAALYGPGLRVLHAGGRLAAIPAVGE